MDAARRAASRIQDPLGGSSAAFLGRTAGRTQLEGAFAVESGRSAAALQSEDDEKIQDGTLPSPSDDSATTTTLLLNWSGTHAVHVPNDRYWEPESIEEVEEIVRHCHLHQQPIRPVGAALSPNALAFHSGGMVSLANLDQIVKVDVDNQLVTVQAGARVSHVVEALRPYDLTLPNLASIAEQQMGGFVSVGAHGTGMAVAPVDHYVTEITLVTPGLGTVTLSEEKDGEIFHLAKVGLGCLGVVVQLTMKCIPAHRLVEHTVVLTRHEAIEQLPTLLSSHKHVRYMWIPYTDAVVVVTNHPEHSGYGWNLPKFTPSSVSEQERLRPLTDLLLQLSRERASSRESVVGDDEDEDGAVKEASAATSSLADFPPEHTPESVAGMGFGELRDALLALDPLNVEHVKRVNQAEAEFWRRSQGIQVKPSDELLQFDCGGQQWVWEVCFPTGTQQHNDGSDLAFMQKLLEGIEANGIPAPAPIEQRWSASSSSLMSPAHGDPDGLHCWVGIINYLPSQDERQRREITDMFRDRYCELTRVVGIPFRAASHWAKLERPHSVYQLVDLQLSLADRFPLHKFNQLRQIYDPNNVLASPTVDLLLGKPPGSPSR
jgi:L-galactono-1,4-lactone dehydrogenase